MLDRILGRKPTADALARAAATRADSLEKIAALDAQREALALPAAGGDAEAAATLDRLDVERAGLMKAVERADLETKAARARAAREHAEAAADQRRREVAKLADVRQAYVAEGRQFAAHLDALAGSYERLADLGSQLVAQHQALGGRLDGRAVDALRVWRRVCLAVNQTPIAGLFAKQFDVPTGDLGRVPFAAASEQAARLFDLPADPDDPDWRPEGRDPAIIFKLGL